MLLGDYVYDITQLLSLYPPSVVESFLSVAGTDISYLFKPCGSRGTSVLSVDDFDIGTAAHPITNLVSSRAGAHMFAYPLTEAPHIPWWQDMSLIIGRLSAKLRKVTVKNTLTGHEQVMDIPSEDVVADIQKKYMECNWQAEGYTWKALRKAGEAMVLFELDMNSTLEENGIADETKIFEKMQMVSANFVPVLYLHLTDSLSMHQNT